MWHLLSMWDKHSAQAARKHAIAHMQWVVVNGPLTEQSTGLGVEGSAVGTATTTNIIKILSLASLDASLGLSVVGGH